MPDKTPRTVIGDYFLKADGPHPFRTIYSKADGANRALYAAGYAIVPVEPLRHACLFIENGIELGYIPVPGEPDPGHRILESVGALKAALSAAQEGE